MGTSQLNLGKRTFLIVDEHGGALRCFAEVLKKQGGEVRACASYDQALACLGAKLFDFVLVDQGGPTFEGRVVLERAIEIDRHTPVLIVTRSLDMQCYLDAMYMGAVDYVLKPIPSASLIRLVETYLRRHCEAA